jgi:hypothetical protein
MPRVTVGWSPCKFYMTDRLFGGRIIFSKVFCIDIAVSIATHRVLGIAALTEPLAKLTRDGEGTFQR